MPAGLRKRKRILLKAGLIYNMAAFKKYHQKILVALFMIFTLPVIFSWIVYTYHGYFHLNTTNHGILVTPPIQVSALFNIEQAQKKQWQIIFAPRHCDDVQSDRILFELHQLRKALGENQGRVNLVLWDNQTCLSVALHDFHKVILNDQQTKDLQNALHQNAKFIADKIYLVDPRGNLFMYYPATTDVMNIFSDLKKVLGVSQIG